jgi:ribA/ribD-fused uncharacterized protein
MSTIKFYRVKDAYGYMSNFAAYPIVLDGAEWPTTEHYFQAQKFLDPAIREQVRLIESPMAAAQLGRRRDLPLRSDWEAVKDEAMYRALRAKFTQHPALREQLLATGDARLVEHTANDSYWADGGDGSGKNMLGVLLMRLRDELRQEG